MREQSAKLKSKQKKIVKLTSSGDLTCVAIDIATQRST
jgi:hypothetical protein